MHFTADYEKVILKHTYPFKRVSPLKLKKILNPQIRKNNKSNDKMDND